MEVLQLAETLAKKWTLARQAKLRLADLEAMVDQRTQELRRSNEKLGEEISERSRAQALLSEFSSLGSLLSAARTIRQAGQIIVAAADRLLNWDACLMDLYAPDTDMLTHVLNVDLIDGQRHESVPNCLHRPPSLLERRAIREGAQLLTKNDANKTRPKRRPIGETTHPFASLMCVPMRNGNAVTAIVSLISYTPNAFARQSLETLQALADYCGGALDRIRSEEALRKAREQLRQSQKLEAIGQLAGGIAHDFNNLLAVIGGNCEFMRGAAQGLPGEVCECLNEVSAATQRAANLTRQLLMFSRKEVMQPKPVDLNNVIVNLNKMLARIIGEDIDLQYDYASALPLVQGDIGMLEQVLVNLVVNARDAMPEGGQLFITTKHLSFDVADDPSHPEARPGAFVCVTVKDTGTGISPENLPRIFDPFFTTKEVGKGTGLGLATVYGIVKQHGGWLDVSSQVGAGCTFKILLPALECARPVLADETPEVELPRGKETVLLVEDEESVRSITRRHLERSGYHVLEAGSGPQAMKIWEAAVPEIDLLLTDVLMPEGVSGRKLAQDLRGKKPSLKVIFYSGYSEDVMGENTQFLRKTNSYFLQKPCPPRNLLCAVRRCLDGLPA